MRSTLPIFPGQVFPEMYRTLCDGELSLRIERYGGIDGISFIDTVERNGILLPDQNPTPVLTRYTAEGKSLFCSAIRFIGRRQDGSVRYFAPLSPKISSWSVSGGTETEKLELYLAEKCIFVRCTAPEMRTLEIYFEKENFFSGTFDYYKNQRLAKVEPRYLDRIGEPYDLSDPVPNGIARNRWEKPLIVDGFPLFHCITSYPYGEQSLFLAVSSDGTNAVFEDLGPQYRLRLNPSGCAVTTVIAIGNDREETRNRAKSLDFDKVREEKEKHLTEIRKSVPEVSIEGIPSADAFFRDTAEWLESMVVGEGAGVRASSHNYGFFPLWDAVWPIREFLWRGACAEAEKMLRYLIAYPHMEAMPWIAFHLILGSNEYLACRKDPAFLKFAMPYFRKYLDIALRMSHPETGFLISLDNCANDRAEQCGVNGFFAAADVNIFWYGGLRVLANFGKELGDNVVAEKILPVLRKLEKNYLPYFFVPEKGYLRFAVDENLHKYPLEIWLATATTGMDYLYGQYFLRSKVKDLAEFQAKELYHPMGHIAVPPDSPIPCEMWRSVHMNQHLGHESKVARLGGIPDEAYRILKRYFETYECYGIAIETFNYTGCCGDEMQNANFQSFSAAAACEGIRTGVAGISLHRGGYFYIPAASDREIFFRNIPLSDRKIDILVTGKGRFAEMFLDDHPVTGTLQIPADAPAFRTWKIVRKEQPQETMQLLCALDLPVSALKTTEEELSFTAGGTGYFPILVRTEKPVYVTVNGTAIPFEYNETEQFVSADVETNTGDRIVFHKKP